MKRFFEMVPGILAWLTLIFMVLFSWLLPVWVSIFIILFDIYWVLKTVYLSLHLRATFMEMRRVMKIDWLARDPRRIAGRRRDRGGRGSDRARPTLSEIYHLVILPMYDEPYEVVRESFESLTRVNYDKKKLLVVLALEERAGDAARETGRKIARRIRRRVRKIFGDAPPGGIAG